MLEAKAIEAFYGASHVLHGVSLRVAAGERVAIIGRNGAGKTTFLKSLMNAGPTVRGEVMLDSQPLGKSPAFRRARMGLQLVPEDRRIYEHLTVRENIRMAAQAAPAGTKALDADAIIARFKMLEPVRERGGGQLSGGQQQMVAVARAMAAAPRFLLLDEPTEGLAPAIVEGMVATIRDLCEHGDMALLLSEQNIWFARQLTHRVVVLDTGAVAFAGTWAEFDADPQIKQRHLAV